MTNAEIWQAVLGELEVSLSRANFTTWFRDTAIIDRTSEGVTIGVPNIFTREWLENKYHGQIKSALAKVIGPSGAGKITYQVGARVEPLEAAVMLESATATVETATSAGGRGAATHLNPRYHFEDFVVGSSNKLAYAAANAVAENPGTVYNPLFLYGGVGLGKTHLLHAIGNLVLRRDPSKKVLYVTSERFTNEMVGAIQAGRTAGFKDRYRKIDVLLIDDVQFLAGKEGTQEEFFHTFNALHEENKQIILSSDRPPKSIPTLEDRLRSRFEWGMIADIGAPDLETRTAILRRKRDLKGYEISEEVLDYIAKTIQNNIRELEGALTRIMAYCELNGSEPTMEVASSVLGNILSSPKRRAVTPPQIIERVATLFNLEPEELTGPKRDKQVVVPRQIAAYLMREELGLSYPRIGQELGGRDHTTAMHAVTKIAREIDVDESLRHEVSLARERLYSV